MIAPETIEITYLNEITGKRWGYTADGELWCEDCDGTLMVLVAGHGFHPDYDCEGPDAHTHTCETCEC